RLTLANVSGAYAEEISRECLYFVGTVRKLIEDEIAIVVCACFPTEGGRRRALIAVRVVVLMYKLDLRAGGGLPFVRGDNAQECAGWRDGRLRYGSSADEECEDERHIRNPR